MTEKLVSILTPCYNGEKYIDHYAEALLAQEYSNCQIIFMDDGSTDGTAAKILSYETRFAERGFSFSYHHHQNGGPAYAIAQGLQYVTGDYLTWPDVDDRLTPDSIRKKVELLEEHPEYGIVRTDYKAVLEEDPNVEIGCGVRNLPDRFHEEVFEDCIKGNSVWYQPGCYMVRMDAFLRANPDRYIYYPAHGQNIQMLLPVFYYYKCAFLPEALYVYVIHPDSRQRQAERTYESLMQSFASERDTMEATIQHMHIPQGERYIQMAKMRYSRMMFNVAYHARKQQDARRCHKEYRNAGGRGHRLFLKSVFAGSELFHAAVNLRKRIRRAVAARICNTK